MTTTVLAPAEPVVAIVGATGTGKSDLAMDLAERLGGEIVNTDAMQLYRGMDIGTAKVPVGERRGLPHHMLDVLDLHEEASVAVFRDAARQAIRDIQGRGKRPILVGGSGLYTRAVLDVIEFPPTDPAVRARLEAEAEEDGLEALRVRLAEADPVSATAVKDARRIIRALEVVELTGRPFSSFMPERRYAAPAVQIGLSMDRATLHERLERRIGRMMADGLIEETERLEERGLSRTKTAARAIGYAQALAVLQGGMTRDEAAAETLVKTRQFARRQETWFRADPRVLWLPAESREREARAAAWATGAA
ncbi:tRNA (adenosine(37)-N6)-dimethylallyltransferase MiaA [Falsarthrobacter nasiphocae]|uniref:tRNA dimethylallyltransferase n=1 Tax=Falsarthrobacter nasiphocae TaxID=189863 RepID=A0AAE3YIK0_9MICC|nr:tRNA (adenosine(37)-N6)-dimethylallyltransferase MiaA [Falsarthrobacter nasiphocae]MDR6892676.1 tRNA dimethylallyltransferase [Falsarthrobacter nasiphocae]